EVVHHSEAVHRSEVVHHSEAVHRSEVVHRSEAVHRSSAVDQSVYGLSNLDNCSTVSLKVTKSVPYSLYQYSTVSAKIAKSVCPGAVPWSRASQCRSPIAR